MRWFLSTLIFLFGSVFSAYALEGVGARADRLVEGGVSIEIIGKTAPWAEVVVVDEAQGDKVMAVAEVEKEGEFEFSFDLLEGQGETVTVFVIDEAGMTSRVFLEEFLGVNKEVLMPATIVNDPFDLSEDAVALTGFGYGESDVDIHIYSSGGFDGVYGVGTDVGGQWRLKVDDLSAGKYTATVQIFAGELESQLSQEIYFEIGGGAIVEVVTEAVGELVTTTVTAVIERPEETARVVVPTVATAVVVPLLLRDGLALLLRLFLALSNLFAWGKKRKSWGVVYDSVTKRPLSRAVVRLFSVQGRKLLETDVTGERGVFSFLPRPGEYFLGVVRNGFRFPSQLIKGTGSDGEYSYLYHGEAIKIAADEAVVISMPVDPVKYRPGFWFYARHYGSIAWNVISWVLLAVGLVSSSLALWREVNVINLIIFAVEIAILIWVLWEVGRKVVGWSVVRDDQGKSVSGVTISLYEVEFKRMVQRRVSDERGRFQMVVPPGKYKLEVAKEGYVVDLERAGGFDGGLIEVGGKKEKVIKVRVYLKKVN